MKNETFLFYFMKRTIVKYLQMRGIRFSVLIFYFRCRTCLTGEAAYHYIKEIQSHSDIRSKIMTPISEREQNQFSQG